MEAFENWDRYCWMKLHRRKFLIENNIFFNDYRTMEDVEHAALVYVKCKSLCYTDIVGINYRMNRKGSLVTFTRQNMKDILKSFETNKRLYKNLPPEIKYRLLGFDYYLICHKIEQDYVKGELTILEILFIITKLTNKDSKKYISTEVKPPAGPLLIFWKIIIKKCLGKYYPVLVRLKKRLISY